MDSRAVRWIPTARANYFGFQAKMGFEEGLKNTIDWYRANQK